MPDIEPLLPSGVICTNGIDVDDHCRTSAGNIFAIGDLALHHNRYANGYPIRLESVQNANDQAMTLARFLTGNPIPYDAVPWFWSDHFDLRLQTIGLSLS